MSGPDSKRKDLSCKTFGRLKVGAVALAEKGLVYWKVTCECGVSKTIKTAHLTSGRVKSCGCLSKEMTIERTATHRMSKTPIYKVWSAIQQRCTNPKNNSYKYYGGRGIKICDRWLKFDNFFEDMGPSYKKGLSIERAEVNGDYEK